MRQAEPGQLISSDDDKDSLDYDAPQETGEIEKIVSEARAGQDQPLEFPDLAVPVDVVVAKNDPRLWQTKNDGSCTVYSYFYVIQRSPFLRDLFHAGVRMDSDNYYFRLRVEGSMYMFRIPMEVITQEKTNDKHKLYPTDMEFLLAISVLCHVVMFTKYGFIDRLAFQPFVVTDLFFDMPFLGIGERSEISFSDSLVLKTDLYEITLESNGDISFKDGDTRAGHYVFILAFYPVGFTFGHCVSVFFDFKALAWCYYSTMNDERYGIPGEHVLPEIVPITFNGLGIMSGVPNIAPA